MKGLDVKWFKHYIGMTNDEKLKALYEIYGDKGFACTVIWSKILEKAAQDGGYFRVSDGLPYDDVMLAVTFSDVIRFYPFSFLKEVLAYFLKMNMLSLDVFGYYTVVNWEKYQGTQLSTPRVQEFRDRKAIEETIDEIMLYFNTVTGKRYNLKTRSYREHLRARLNDGYTVDQIKAVVSFKHKMWIGDPHMSKYITPDTLFRPGHFDRYLNEIPIEEQKARGDGTMLNVIDANGNRIMVTQEQYDRAEKGYFTIVK